MRGFHAARLAGASIASLRPAASDGLFPVAAWGSQFRRRILEALEADAATFRELLSAGISIEEHARFCPPRQ